MKLHLPKMLAAALLAAIASVSTYADEPHTGTVYTYDNTTSGSDPAFGRYAETTYDSGSPVVTDHVISGRSGNWGDVQNIFAKATITTCNTMRFDSTHGQTTKTLNYTFTPFTVGGFIVEEGATGFSINSSGTYDREFLLGNNSTDSAYSYIREDFAVNKTTGSKGFVLRGTQTINIADGKTFTLQSNNGFDFSGSLTTTGSGTLNIASGDVLVGTATSLTFGSDVSIGGKLSVNASKLTAGGAPLLTLTGTGTGTLTIGNFEITGTSTLADGTYNIVSTNSTEVATTLLGFWSDTEELKLTNDSGTLKLTVKAGTGPIEITANTDLLYTSETTRGYHITNGATLGINNGSGSKGSAAAGDSYDYGPITVEGEGCKLSVWHWTTSAATLNTDDKVAVASTITVKDGGTIFMEDGSYHFAGGVNVAGSGSIQMQWAKGALLNCLTSEDGTASDEFTFTALGNDPADRTQLYGLLNDGDFAGTVKLDTRGAGPLHFSIGSENALQNAMLNLGDGTHSNIVALNTAETNMRGIQGTGTIALATNLTGNAGITESSLNLTGTGSTFSGTIGEGVTVAVAKGADLTLSGTLGLYKPFDVSGTLTLSSDLVIDLANLAYEEKEGTRVYTLATLEQDASYTGYNALTKSSIKGVSAEEVTFKNDGTIELTTAVPHTISWDPNWGVTGPDALSAELTATTALITSPYNDGSVVVVELTGSGNPDAFIYGGQDSGVNSTGATYAANVWIDAKEGSYKAIVGGNFCNNWNDGGTLNFEGDTHIQIDGATVGTIVGGNLKDGKRPQFTGSSYISVVSGDVTATIIGSSTNSHSSDSVQTGDTHIFIYVPLATESTNALSANQAPHLGDYVIGGGAHVDNPAGGTNTINGSTNVTIDLSKYSGERTSFVKSVVGGHFSENSTHGQTITGSTNVTIKGGGIQFTRDIIGGSYFNSNSNSSTIDGGVTLGIEGGTYGGNIIGGSKVTNSAGSTLGAVKVTLGGAAQVNGNVYAAGVIDGESTSASTVASTTVNLGADVTLGGTLSGGFGGANADCGTVTDSKLLNLTDAKEYTALATATVNAFDEISVVKGGSATITTLSNAPFLTKSGEGALTLALGGESAIMNMEVGAGTLTLGAADMDIMGITVDSGAVLAAAAGSSLQTAAITLTGGSTLSVGTEGLVLAEDSSLTMDGGKVNITTTGTPGQEVILITGLTEDDSITGITFDKTDKSGNKYANSSDYLTLSAPLAEYTQLKVKDGKLILTKAAGEGSYWGKGLGEGEWDLASLKWADDDNQVATRTFTPGSAAHFTAAGLGGRVNVGEAIDVTTIYVSGATYNFTNAENLNITSGISVSESGSATFDKLADKELGTIGIGSNSTMLVKEGNVAVQTFSNEGDLTVSAGSLTVKNATAKGGNVVVKNLTLTGENTFGTVKVSGTVSGATSIKVGGTSRITTLSGVNELNLTDGTLTLGATNGLNATTLSGALTTGPGVNLGSLTMNDGSSIKGNGAVTASGVSVTGTADILGGTTLQTASVGGTGTLKMASGSTMSGSNLSVADKATLELLEGSTLANTGTLSVTGKVIAGNGIDLGTVAAKGTVEVNGASVSATGGSIAALDMGSGETLTVDNNLALTSTTGGNSGTLNVGGALTAGGAVTVANVTAGSLELTTTGSLTATGTLDTESITLDRVSKTDHYLTAGALSATATDFVVDKAMVAALDASVGSIITLADLGTQYTGDVTINGGRSFSDKDRRVYTIMQDSTTHDIVLTVDAQESGFVWIGREGTLWSTAGNWSGGTVPGSEDWVQVKNDANSHDIELDGDAEVSYFSVSATDATLRGAHTLEVGSALEVNVNGMLYVGDASTPTAIETPTATINGTLVVQPRSAVQADATTINGGTLNVNDATYIAGTIDMAGGSLRTSLDSFVTTGQLNGDADSIVGGHVIITGTGSRYTGEYDTAYIDIDDDAEAVLYARKGLTLGGDGTAKLQYSGNTAIDGIDADELTILLNDPNSSSIGTTLTLRESSWLEEGSVEFGMSAIQSAKMLGTGAPVILQGDLTLDDDARVVVNQDRDTDKGKVMQVGNFGETRNLVLARFGSHDTNTRNVVLNGDLYAKYFKNARIEAGELLVDLNDTYYQTVSGATTHNGRAGAGMLDAAFVERNPQAYEDTWNGDLAAVMTALDNGAYSADRADRILAAMAGASAAAMGAAWNRDVDRQLRAIRNRTTSMGVAECVVNEDMPFFNVWINAECDYTKLNNDGTLAGYKLSSWGGTVGMDVDFTNRFTMGLAVTAMSGDLTASSAENAEGDLDRLYVSVFGRYTHRSWTHTLVGTFGMADTKLKRTVDYGTGSYTTNSSSNGTAFGVMYEAGYTIALNESATSCLQPVLNLSYRHSSLDGCSETGTDAALRGSDVDMDVFTMALGARLQSVVGTSVYNRASLFEGRVMFKLDTGDRAAAMENSFSGVSARHNVKSSELGAFGLEIGAGVTVPIAEDGGALFFDVTGEFRSKCTEVNGTVGYRYNF